MTDDTRRSDDWTGKEWAGETGDRTTDADADATAPTTDEWNKTEYVGDRGNGAPAPVDPDTMPEGSNAAERRPARFGESHWAGENAEPATGDRPLDRPDPAPTHPTAARAPASGWRCCCDSRSRVSAGQHGMRPGSARVPEENSRSLDLSPAAARPASGHTPVRTGAPPCLPVPGSGPRLGSAKGGASGGGSAPGCSGPDRVPRVARAGHRRVPAERVKRPLGGGGRTNPSRECKAWFGIPTYSSPRSSGRDSWSSSATASSQASCSPSRRRRTRAGSSSPRRGPSRCSSASFVAGPVSGAHLNPAVTHRARRQRRDDVDDVPVYLDRRVRRRLHRRDPRLRSLLAALARRPRTRV